MIFLDHKRPSHKVQSTKAKLYLTSIMMNTIMKIWEKIEKHIIGKARLDPKYG
jgi:hypothetical protein